jgi:hypothetical protein
MWWQMHKGYTQRGKSKVVATILVKRLIMKVIPRVGVSVKSLITFLP